MYIDKEEYTNHINDPIDKITIRKILDKIEIVLQNYTVESTDFLNPHEIHLARSVLNRFKDLDFLIDGKYENAERQVILIYPEYLSREDIEIPLSALKIDGDLKGIMHKDYLGAALSLGLKRNKIGDILIYKNYSIIIVKEEISSFIIYNLEKIKNNNIKVSTCTLDHIKAPMIEYKEIVEFLVSLRLDSVISGTFNLSRKDSMKTIKSKNVKINFEFTEKPSKEIQEGDLISVKGFGRFILSEVKGKSKSGRFICIIRIIL